MKVVEDERENEGIPLRRENGAESRIRPLSDVSRQNNTKDMLTVGRAGHAKTEEVREMKGEVPLVRRGGVIGTRPSGMNVSCSAISLSLLSRLQERRRQRASSARQSSSTLTLSRVCREASNCYRPTLSLAIEPSFSISLGSLGRSGNILPTRDSGSFSEQTLISL